MSIKHNRDKGTATTKRQGKHKPVVEAEAVEFVIKPYSVIELANMDMLKADLIGMAEAMGLSTKGTKQELIDRMQA